MLQERPDDVEVIQVGLRDRVVAPFDVAVVGREIERRPAALVRHVHVAAAVDEQLRERVVPVVDRGQQRRPAVLGGLVDLRAAVEQRFRGFEVALARGEHQRRQPAAAAAHQPRLDERVVVGRRWIGRPSARRTRGAGWIPALERHLLVVGASRGRGARAPLTRRFDRAHVDGRRHVVPRQARGTGRDCWIGARREQRLHRLGVPLLRGPHQPGRAAQRLARVDVRAGGDEPPDDIHAAVARREHERRLPIRPALFRVRAGREQPLDDPKVAVETRHRQRRQALAIGRAHVRARRDQPIDGLQVAAVDGREQRRRLVSRAPRTLGHAARTLRVRGLRANADTRTHGDEECEETTVHNVIVPTQPGPYRLASLPVLSPCTSFSIPYRSRRLSSRLPVVTDFRS